MARVVDDRPAPSEQGRIGDAHADGDDALVLEDALCRQPDNQAKTSSTPPETSNHWMLCGSSRISSRFRRGSAFRSDAVMEGVTRQAIRLKAARMASIWPTGAAAPSGCGRCPLPRRAASVVQSAKQPSAAESVRPPDLSAS